MKPIKIECPNCGQHIEVESETAGGVVPIASGRIFIVLLLLVCAGIVFLCWSQWRSSHGEFDFQVRTIENSAHAEYDRYLTNGHYDLTQFVLTQPGSFDVDYLVYSNRQYGWDLVNTMPLQETTYPLDKPPYVRTGAMTLIFRRPK